MSKLPSLTEKQLANAEMVKLANEKASMAQKRRDKRDASKDKWALPLPSISSRREESPKRDNPPPSKKSCRNNMPSASNELSITDFVPTQGIMPSNAISRNKSLKKSSDATDPFEVKGSVASLLKSVRAMKVGGKRTKKVRKTHKKTPKAKSRKNRRHSAKK